MFDSYLTMTDTVVTHYINQFHRPWEENKTSKRNSHGHEDTVQTSNSKDMDQPT